MEDPHFVRIVLAAVLKWIINRDGQKEGDQRAGYCRKRGNSEQTLPGYILKMASTEFSDGFNVESMRNTGFRVIPRF